MSSSPSASQPAPESTLQPQPQPQAANWSPSTELKVFTDMLTNAQLAAIGDRSHALTQLKHFSAKHIGIAGSQIRACNSIKNLPFIRLPLAMRSNPLNADFIAPARGYNRELLQAKTDAGLRLRHLCNDPALPPKIAEYASRVNGRAPLMKVECGELNDVEIPAHLLPPTNNTKPELTPQILERAAERVAEKAAAKAEAAAARESLAEAFRLGKSTAEAEARLKERDQAFNRRVLANINPGGLLEEAMQHARTASVIPASLIDELAEATRKFDVLKRQHLLPTYRR